MSVYTSSVMSCPIALIKNCHLGLLYILEITESVLVESKHLHILQNAGSLNGHWVGTFTHYNGKAINY